MTHLTRLLLTVLLGFLPLTAQERLTFLGVALDLETRNADRKLLDHLARTAGLQYAQEDLEYEAVLKQLSLARSGGPLLLARATPYVCVAAELLGADIEVLGTYVSSATRKTTYRSHFVVSKKAFPVAPDLPTLYAHLRARRARFIYHSPFSTSSFFLPSLYFRAEKLFHMPENTESLSALDCVRIEGNSSSRLVEMVAGGEADVAAVWDGTRTKALTQSHGGAVHFVPMPTELPNDLLVCSRHLDPKVKDALKASLRAMAPDHISTGDFLTWRVFEEQTEARKALADLRWQARQRTTPVTVEVRMAKGTEGTPGTPRLLEAARQAVRLAATELVPFDPDYHEHVDYTWTLRPMHDGALEMSSQVPGFDMPPQIFRISYRAAEDLTQRLIALVHGRLHRIRTVWPYSSRPPLVIRDTAFTVPVGAQVKVHRVTWLDPERDKFRAGPVFKVRVAQSDYFRYELDLEDIKAGSPGTYDLNPLGNESFRVLLCNPAQERPLFRWLTLALVGLLAGAAGVALWALRKGEDKAASGLRSQGGP